MKTPKEFMRLYDERSLTRTRASIRNLDSSTDMKTREGPKQQEWATAREKERQQLQD